MKQLIVVAKELNEVLGLAPAIKVAKTNEEDLTAEIKKAAKLIDHELDVFTLETIKTLMKLGFWKGEIPEEAEVEAEEETEIEPEEIDDDEAATEDDEAATEDEEDEEDDYSELIAAVKATKKLGLADCTVALKKLVKKYDVFAKLRKDIAGKFNNEDIRDSMLEILGKSEMKTTKQVKEPEEKVKETPVKTPKKEKEVKAPKEKTESYSRVDSVCEALLESPKTIEDWVVIANKKMVAKKGQPNASEAKFIIRYILKMAKHFDFGVNVPIE